MVKVDHTSQVDFMKDLYCFDSYNAYTNKTYLYQKRYQAPIHGGNDTI